jgi:hypothetical protein
VGRLERCFEEVWDNGRQKWKPLVNAAANYPVKVRVHQLAKPAHTGRFRIIVNNVVLLDGHARLLQVEE